MTEMPRFIELLIDESGAHTLLIDGDEFPWEILAEGWSITSGDESEFSNVTIRIPSYAVQARYQIRNLDVEPRLDVVWMVGDEFRLKADTPEPANVTVLKQLVGGPLPYFIKNGDGFWSWSNTDEWAYYVKDGAPWDSWVSENCNASYMNKTFRVEKTNV